jgi:protein-L-isoaspartate(D-aspartate) O-methyltransferase
MWVDEGFFPMNTDRERRACDVAALRKAFGSPTLNATKIELPNDASTVLSEEQVVRSQLELAALQPGLRVLEIGSGTGYLCARMAHLVGDPHLIYGMDIIPEVVELAHRNLQQSALDQIRLLAADGLRGWPGTERFDRVILSCSVYEFPWQLVEQLAPGGTMVLPIERGWPIEGLLLAVQQRCGCLVPIAASVGRFVPACGQEAPPPLSGWPAPPLVALEAPEYEITIAGDDELGELLCIAREWNRGGLASSAELNESALMRCGALLSLLHPSRTCFVGAKGLGPVGVGVYSVEPLGAAVVTCSFDPPNPYRFGRVYSLGDPKPVPLLREVIERAASPTTTWLHGIQRTWCLRDPWRKSS